MACAPRGITVLTACDDATKARVYDKAALIVDDSRTQRLLFTKKLESWGYSTQEAVSGRAALDLCATQHFDLILSDWIMPEMDGLEFCRAFRALRQDAYTYFILLTSKNEKDAVAQGLDVGADDFLSKPVAANELRARIRAGERLLQMEREMRSARSQLVAAVEALDDGFIYFDADDRLVLANEKYREFYALSAPALVPGAKFEDILRYGLEYGQFSDTLTQEDIWIRERLAKRQESSRSQQRLQDGTVLQIVERRTADGGRVGLRVDVTELTEAREAARRAEARAVQQNTELRAALAELQLLYDALDRDLMQARRLQQSLIRKREHAFDGSALALLLQSSGHVGGDMVGTFQISADQIGIYAIDVAGHGVAAAMLGARIAGLFSARDHHQNIVFKPDRLNGGSIACAPHEVAARINDLMLDEFGAETYLTILYAEFNLKTGKLRLVQAGHPHPVIQRANGTLDILGEGGHPIGLFTHAHFSTVEAQMAPGDRLFIYSDGITECTNRKGAQFGQEGVSRIMTALSGLKGADFMDALKSELTRWAGREEFDDDVSGALLEFENAAKTPHGADSFDQNMPAIE
jgi:serine phosphatase RsbU (regulator of sigma subunit)/DNA-binding response OmpR family regulator